MPTLPELRLNKFLTQQDLAGKVGVHATLVSDWERGIYRPSMRNLRKLCEVLEVTPGQIDWPEPKKDLDVRNHVEAAQPSP
jgi:transcriptional regulator with XRE-family HTH domain